MKETEGGAAPSPLLLTGGTGVRGGGSNMAVWPLNDEAASALHSLSLSSHVWDTNTGDFSFEL